VEIKARPSPDGSYPHVSITYAQLDQIIQKADEVEST
jgi:hypothetical protein